MEDQLDRIEHAVAEMRAQMASGFAGVEQQFAVVRSELREEIRQGDSDTRSQLGAQIESLRDDVRIFAEAHVALEQRVTRLEPRQG